MNAEKKKVVGMKKRGKRFKKEVSTAGHNESSPHFSRSDDETTM
ncbi:hypothetical protein NPIL_557521, partial [Nephila pilipes]